MTVALARKPPFGMDGMATGNAGYVLRMAALGGLLLAALALQKSGMADVLASYVFVTAVLGVIFPVRLLEAYLFCLALFHRDFTYLSLSVFGAPLYITEWTLFILLTASLFRGGGWVREYPRAVAALAAYAVFGGMMFFIQPSWGLGPMLRDFVIVYYALFIVPVLVFIKGEDAVRRLFAAAAAGAGLNLAGDFLNYLYGTYPWTAEQKNHSLRSSFYYLAVASFHLPLLPSAPGARRWLMATGYGVLWLVVFYYAYSKTAMVAFIVIGALFLAMEHGRKYGIALFFATMVVVPLLVTAGGKTFTLKDALSTSDVSAGMRMALNRTALRDFTEYPYGIGFGAPIFGAHAQSMGADLKEVKALHNSYLTLLRRMGIAGAALFLLLTGAATAGVLGKWRSAAVDSPDKRFFLGLFLAFVSAAIFCYPHVALEGPFFGVFFWCITGCLFVAGYGKGGQA